MEEESKEGFKRCSKCGRFLPFADFNKCSSASDGLQNYCKDCQKEMYAEYRVKNKVKIEAYRQANKEAIADYQAQYRQENKEAIADYQAQYRQAHKEEKKASNAEYCDPQKNPMGWARIKVGMYRQMDRQRGFNDKETITAEWFLDNIAYKPCAHCGVQGIGKVGCNRLDNTKGHTIDNVESCCLKCNVREGVRDQIRRGIHVSCKHKKQSFSDFVNEHLKEKSKK